MYESPKDREHPELPWLEQRRPMRVDLFFANAAAYYMFTNNTYIQYQMAKTAAIFDNYNFQFTVRPESGQDYNRYRQQIKARILHWSRDYVRAPRKNKPNEKEYFDDLTDLYQLALERQPQHERQKWMRVIFCQYDYTDEEILKENLWNGLSKAEQEKQAPPEVGVGDWVKGVTLYSYKDKSGVPPWTVINMRLPLKQLDNAYTLAHELGHAAGLEHPKLPMMRNLMNEGARDGYFLDRDQFRVLRTAPFCQ